MPPLMDSPVTREENTGLKTNAKRPAVGTKRTRSEIIEQETKSQETKSQETKSQETKSQAMDVTFKPFKCAGIFLQESSLVEKQIVGFCFEF